MRAWTFALAFTSLLAIPSVGHASDIDDCNSDQTETIIKGCSQIIDDQVWASFQHDRSCIVAANAGLAGAKNVMWGSDYPHAEGTFPFSKQVVDKLAADNPDVTTDELVAVLGGNAAKLFKRANLQAQVDARRAELMAAA